MNALVSRDCNCPSLFPRQSLASGIKSENSACPEHIYRRKSISSVFRPVTLDPEINWQRDRIPARQRHARSNAVSVTGGLESRLVTEPVERIRAAQRNTRCRKIANEAGTYPSGAIRPICFPRSPRSKWALPAKIRVQSPGGSVSGVAAVDGQPRWCTAFRSTRRER